MVKNPPAKQETWVQSLGREDSLEEGMATHFSILAWRTWGLKESDMISTQTTISFPEYKFLKPSLRPHLREENSEQEQHWP